jgi:hypothetical protein
MASESKVVAEEKQKVQSNGDRRSPRKSGERQAIRKPAAKTSSHQYSTKRKKEVSRMYIVGNAAALVAIVVLVLISMSNSRPRRLPMVPDELPPPTEPTVVTAPVEEVAPPPVVAKGPSLPQGVINVPRVGLRTGHSFSAKAVPGKLRKGERVSIVRRHSPSAGPPWLLIKTGNGTTGWVMASVVK